MQEWLTIIIILLIVGILLDGIRRMRQARRNSLRMSLDMHKGTTHEDLQEYGSELPNGGARVTDRRPEENTEHLDHVSHKIIEDDYSSTSKPSPTEQQTLNLEETVPMLMDSVAPIDSNKAARTAHQRLNNDDTNDNCSEKAEAKGITSKLEVYDVREGIAEPKLSADSNQPMDEPKEGRIEPTLKSTLEKVSPKKLSHKVLSLPGSKDQSEEVLILHIKAVDREYFHGKDLLKLILNQGLRYGEMGIFHRHIGEDGEGTVLFSMANMVVPGAFDLSTFDELSTPGVSVFLRLPMTDYNSMDAFEMMLITAKTLADTLGGEVNDDQHSVMTKQTVEHYRERIRNFSLKQQLLERA